MQGSFASLFDFQDYARRTMTPKVFHFLEDGSTEQVTKNSNETDFVQVLLKQRGMANMKHYKGTTTSFLGSTTLSAPVGLGPMPFLQRFNFEGEVGAALAAKEFKTVFTIDGGRTSIDVEDILKISQGGVKLLQVNSYQSLEERTKLL